MASENFSVYILGNRTNTTLYTGVTNDLKRRLCEHKYGQTKGFTKRYNISKLFYYEKFHDPHSAIAREKQIKGGSRRAKVLLIASMNPGWIDLHHDL